MIEFTGAYSRPPAEKSIVVLVQYDGIQLHVWHLSDPFYRLLSSDVFQLSCFIGRKMRYIKLPHGGRIETDDLEALERLRNNHPALSGHLLTTFLSNRKALIACGVILVLACAWSIAKLFSVS